MRFGIVVAILTGSLVSAFSAPLVAQGPAPAPGSSGTGIIVGQVIDAVTSKGVSGAIVTLGGNRSVITTSDGRFMFRDVPRGDFMIAASKSGFLNGMYGERRPSGRAAPLMLRDGERRADAIIRLWKHASISGTIVDEAGEPLVGIQVTAFQRRVLAGRTRFAGVGNATTDDRGIYRIPTLAPGDYLVAMTSSQVSMPLDVMKQYEESLFSGSDIARNAAVQSISQLNTFVGQLGGADSRQVENQVQSMPRTAPTPPPADGARLFAYPTLFYPAASSPASAMIISLAPAQERSGIDLQAKPVPMARISGTVVGAAQDLTANLPIRLTFDGFEQFGRSADAAGTITDAAGAFMFPAVPAGDYTLRIVQVPRVMMSSGSQTIIAVAGGAMMSSTSSISAPGPLPVSQDPAYWATFPVTVADADITGMTVPLRLGARMSGRVEFDGALEKPTPEEMSHIAIYVEPADNHVERGPSPRVSVDARGQFKTSDMPGGKYFVRTGGYNGWTLKSALLGDRDLADLPVDVSAGDVSNIVITFTDRTASLEGTVHGVDVSRDTVIVVFFPADSKYWSEATSGSRRFRQATVTEKGTYKITSIRPGSYYVAAIAEPANGDWMDPKLFEQLSAIGPYLDIDDGEKAGRDLKVVEVKQ